MAYNFSPQEAVTILGITLAPGRAGIPNYRGDVFTSCFMCASHDAGHLNIHTGQYHCFSCGFAKRDVFQSRPETEGRTSDAPVEEVPQEQEATAAVKHAAYCAVLTDSMFSLSKTSIEYMKKRGLSEETARKYGFRTYPELDPLKDYDRREAVASRIQNKGISVKGVAGFATNKKGNRYICHKNGEGLLLPILDIDRHVVGLRHRPLVKQDGRKETPLSTSGKPGGVSSHAPAGYFCEWEEKGGKWRPVDNSAGELVIKNQKYPRSHVFCVTEGPLKAAIFRQEMPESGPVISISGVSSIRGIKQDLMRMKEMGFRIVEDYLDMDAFIPVKDPKTGKMLPGNVGVRKASAVLQRMCKDAGLIYLRRRWPIQMRGKDGKVVTDLKGIDDYLVFKNHGIIPHTIKEKESAA